MMQNFLEKIAEVVFHDLIDDLHRRRNIVFGLCFSYSILELERIVNISIAVITIIVAVIVSAVIAATVTISVTETSI